MAERVRWTAEADAELRRLAPKGFGTGGIAKLLHRSPGGVKNRAGVLRIPIAADPTARSRAEETKRQVRAGVSSGERADAKLRTRWAALIGPMKDKLRAELEAMGIGG